jgi:hypothetical protein
MSTPEEKWVALENDLLKKYNKFTPAFGYVFQNLNGQKGVRVEAPSIMLEFTDGLQLGRDPAGKLYYKTVEPDFIRNGTYRDDINSKVSYEEFAAGQRKLIVLHVDFYHGTNDKPFSQLISRVPDRAWENLNNAQFANFKQPFDKRGKFQRLDVSQSTAELTSDTANVGVTININSLGKKFKFNFPPSFADKPGFSAWGYFIFREFAKLRTGVNYVVRYTSTGIVILEGDRSVDPVAVFGSYELQNNTQPFPSNDADTNLLYGQFV